MNHNESKHSFLVTLKAYARLKEIQGQKFTKEELDRIQNVVIKKQDKEANAIIVYKDGNIKVCPIFESLFIDFYNDNDWLNPNTVVFYKIFQNNEAVTSCVGRILNAQEKNLSILHRRKIGLYIDDSLINSLKGFTSYDNSFLIIENEKFGFINKEGEIIIEPQYDKIKQNSFFPRYTLLKNKKQDYLFDKFSCNIIDFECEYDNISLPKTIEKGSMDEWAIFVLKRGEEYAAYTGDGTTISSFGEYDYIIPFISGMSLVKKDDLWGIIDFDGDVIFYPQYKQIKNFPTNLTNVCMLDKYGYSEVVDLTKYIKSVQEKDEDQEMQFQNALDDAYNEECHNNTYDSTYYNEVLDLDQQEQDFWEEL